MERARLLLGAVSALTALLLAGYVSLTLWCKGPILAPSYLWLTAEEKAKTDQKAEYRQATILSGSLCGTFLFCAVALFTGAAWAALCYWSFGIVSAVYYLATLVLRWKNKHKDGG